MSQPNLTIQQRIALIEAQIKEEQELLARTERQIDQKIAELRKTLNGF